MLFIYYYFMNKIIFVWLLTLAACCALNIQSHLDLNSYLSQFKQKHSRFQQSLNKLSLDIDQTKLDSNNQVDLDAKIHKLEQSIIRQKNLLNQASLELIPPNNQINWKCPELQGTTVDELKGLAGDLGDQTNKLNGIITDLKGKQTPESIQNGGAAVLYSDAIKQSLNPQINYYNPDGSKIAYISDLSGGGWTPGSLTPEQIQKKIAQTKENNDIVKTCPSSTPYFNGQNCINCESGSYFNLQSNTCFSCSDFNLQGRQCLSSTGNFDGTNIDQGKPRLILPAGVSPDTLKDQINNPCPADRPFMADKYCVQCSGSNPLFDYQKQQCTQCQNNYVYSPEEYKCLKQPIYDTNYPIAKQRIIIPENETLVDLEAKQAKIAQTENLIVCEAKTPFFKTDTKQCIQCPEGSYFHMEKNQCIKCPDGLIYYYPSHRCLKSPIYSNLVNQNWTSINPNQVKEEVNQTKQMQFSQQCPIQKPFFNGNQCIKCTENKIFSFDTEECTVCSEGTIFSLNLHQCLKPEGDYQTNPKTAPNLIYGGFSKSEWSSIYYENIQKNPNIADCPKQKPYFQGIVCINCPTEHPYFNLQYKMCQTCEQNSQYDSQTGQCLNEGGDIIDQTPNFQKMAAGVFT